jgi:hypothetical protein
MKQLTAFVLGISLALGTAALPASADDKYKEKTKVDADGDDYKSKTTVKGKHSTETTKVKSDDDDYKSTTKTKTRSGTVKSKTKVHEDDGKVKVDHEEKTK